MNEERDAQDCFLIEREFCRFELTLNRGIRYITYTLALSGKDLMP